ncbi:MAG: hypothetical protein M1837_001750 [Sclerophora amabilis]|nr:MAG: hypothetical protein M1837_001750 [Sclerophora amabilis]
MANSSDEFPLLAAHGLYAADIRGDGNCLFNALSDQIYGNQNEHQKIRARVIDYMREHASYYKQFIDVYSGGGVRRNPKRKNAGAYSTPLSTLPPSAEDVDRVFEGHLLQMARGGTYGDNMEISAFSAAFRVDVKIYQRDLAYVVSGGEEVESREMAHIAYHAWEHYSSIRNISGPHTGPPQVQALEIGSDDERKGRRELDKTPYTAPWMIEVVVKSLPFLADRVTIKRTLEESKGRIDEAVSKLLDAEDQGSVSSAPDSSSVERDPDSEDENPVSAPNKKRDRRLSRATRVMQKGKNEHHTSHLAPLKPINTPPLPNGTTVPKEERDEEQKQAFVNVVGPEPEKNNNDPKDEDEDFRSQPSPKDSDTTSEYSDTSKMSFSDRSYSRSSPPSSSSRGPTHGRRKPGRPRGSGLSTVFPPQKRVTARERKELKKAAQKAAAKQRKQEMGGNGAGEQAVNGAAGRPDGNRVMAIRTGKENTPVIEAGIKVLYI